MNPLRSTPHPHLLEISARSWIVRLTREIGRAVTLGDVPDSVLDEIAARGFHGVWLMGVWTTGEAARRRAFEYPDLLREYGEALPDWSTVDVGGSPYAIRDYSVSPSLGRDVDLERLRSRLADRGVGLVLDFVPNHLSVDHPWLDSHPDRFVRGSAANLAEEPANWFVHRGTGGEDHVFAHGRDPYFPGWTDTVQLDYRAASARRAMTDLLLDLSTRCDGLRCDMAMLALPEIFHSTWGSSAEADFWGSAIEELRATRPETVLVAEVYWGLEARLIELGFDFTYAKGLYDAIVASDLAAIRHHVDSLRDSSLRPVHFLENHDEERALERLGDARLRSSAAVTYGLPGMRFFQDGQLEGRRVRVPVQLVRAPDEAPLDWCREFHEELLDLLREPIFHRGEWTPLESEPGSHESVVGSLWSFENDLALVGGNLSDRQAWARIRLPFPPTGAERVGFADPLSGRRFEESRRRTLEEGLRIELAPWEAFFLRVEPERPLERRHDKLPGARSPDS